MQFEVHPYAAHFPLMDDAAISRLADSIKRNGLREPIKLRKSDRLLIDGRNRLAACVVAKVTPDTELVDLDELATLELIADLNIDRRHLTQSQKAEAAAVYAQLVEENKSAMLPTYQESELPKRGIQSATKAAAAKFGVSERTVRDARTAIEADPENAKKIASGEVSANAAAKAVRAKKAAAKKPPEPQKISGGTTFEPAELERPLLKDANGDDVPESLRMVFGEIKDELKACADQCKAVEAKALEIALRKVSRTISDVFTPIHRNGKDTFEQGDLGMFRHKLKRAMPHALCPFCKGNEPAKCRITDPVTAREIKPCDERGWMEKDTYDKAKKLIK